MVYEIIYYYLLYIIGYLQNINVEKKKNIYMNCDIIVFVYVYDVFNIILYY